MTTYPEFLLDIHASNLYIDIIQKSIGLRGDTMDYRSGTHTIGKVRQAAEYAYTEFGYDYTTATKLANQFVNAVISDDCIDEYDENTALSNRAITNVCYDMFSTDEQEKYFYDILWGY